MKATSFHYSNKLSSSVAFKPQEDIDCAVVLAGFARSECRLPNAGVRQADAPFYSQNYSLQNLGRGTVYSLRSPS